MKPLFTTFFLLIPLSIMAQSEVQEIKKTLIEMWDAIEKNDPDRYARYIHPDFTQFGETDAILLEGKTAEVESIKNWLQNSSDIHT
ncbi:MAG: hypothetical protein WBN28_13690 [Lutimonas sp.]